MILPLFLMKTKVPLDKIEQIWYSLNMSGKSYSGGKFYPPARSESVESVAIIDSHSRIQFIATCGGLFRSTKEAVEHIRETYR